MDPVFADRPVEVFDVPVFPDKTRLLGQTDEGPHVVEEIHHGEGEDDGDDEGDGNIDNTDPGDDEDDEDEDESEDGRSNADNKNLVNIVGKTEVNVSFVSSGTGTAIVEDWTSDDYLFNEGPGSVYPYSFNTNFLLDKPFNGS